MRSWLPKWPFTGKIPIVIAECQGRAMTSITGGCLCGQVRYTITAAPLWSGICHCPDCKRYTGSAFEPFMVIPIASFSPQGELKSFEKPGSSGRTVHRHFCPNCGSGIFNRPEILPTAIAVLVGTLDEPSMFVPTNEIFCHVALPWVKVGGETQRFPKGRTS